jgi:hypothetical protein
MYDRAFVQLVPFAPAVPGGSAAAGFRSQNHAEVRYYVEVPGDDGVRLYEYPRTKNTKGEHLSWSAREQLGPPIGYVRDFIKIPTKWGPGGGDIWPWVFNVADMLLVGGVALLALRMLYERRHREATAATPAAEAADREGV